MRTVITICCLLAIVVVAFLVRPGHGTASSHREAPMISNDPQADNTDLYVFRSPDDLSAVTIIANYVPLELPEGGPNFATFGEYINYDIHIKNQTDVGGLGSAKDNITYRFTFDVKNEDTTTFFNIRLGKQNLKTTYTCQKSTDGGSSWTTIVTNGVVPPPNIGPRSITGPAGLGAPSYHQLAVDAIKTASTGETVFCGPRDDPFFADLGGIFDLGQTRSAFGADPSNAENARDAVAGFNTHSIALKIPIAMLQKDGKTVDQAANILDPDFVIGVWASASRPQMKTLDLHGGRPSYSGPYIQVSRLGMPLTNEAIIPIGEKDRWNATSPYDPYEQHYVQYFANPELALYMDSSKFAAAVPAFERLNIQSSSYPAIGVIPGYSTPGFDFRNGRDGAFAVTRLTPPPDLSGTAFAANVQPGLVDSGKPRLVDIFPIFYFGVPNLIPYQLATGKTAGPLSAGKPFIHNFLPIINDNGMLYGGDMVRLNMATPVTPRGTADYTANARMGLIQAAVLGLTDTMYNQSTNVQSIPHMDGFPNGRRLEDDVTTIELQAVGGLVLAAVGLPFNDATAADYSDLASPKLVEHLGYNAGPTKNDVALQTEFPYAADPHSGFDYVKKLTADPPASTTTTVENPIGLATPQAFLLNQNYPNPFNPSTEIRYAVAKTAQVTLKVYNTIGQEIVTLVDGEVNPGEYKAVWNAQNVASGTYYYRLSVAGEVVSTRKAVLIK